MVIDQLARNHKSTFIRQEGEHETAEACLFDKQVILAKPLTYMNRSGESVLKLLDDNDITSEHLLVISDDFNIPFGMLRVRPKGSDGGHNGLASIIEALKTQNFSRLRVGIGHDDIGQPADFVLSEFSKHENRYLQRIIDKCTEACEYYLVAGITNTMNRFNNTLID
jgi:PTH1 family peptidyl-tRNA hydrolase